MDIHSTQVIRLFGQISTLARSEFTDGSGAYRPSSWDRRHVASVNMVEAAKSWDVGGRIGKPSTPCNNHFFAH